jgi:sugar phosphate isomerase/epimerase
MGAAGGAGLRKMRTATMKLTRRDALKATALLALSGETMLNASPLGLPIGSQTYPHRQLIKDGHFADLLKTLKEIGIDEIELCSALGYAEFAPLADAKATKQAIAGAGMKCVSAHFSLRELRQDQQKSLDWAKEIGITQIIVATLGGGSTPTMDDVKKAADEYNRIADVSAKAGLQQGLHNETFEVAMVDGRRVYDVLFDLLDPKLVKFQFQMSTIAYGLVAADYFAKYPGRFYSIHIQDVDLNAAPPAGTQARGRGVQTSVGKGSIDWKKTFEAAAKSGGIKNYFVEQNMDLTKASVAALKAMNP